MIVKAHWKNFKALQDVTVDFERFTVLVGPNGSGKSTVLEGIERAALGLSVDHRQVFGDENDRLQLRTRGVEGDLPIELKLWLNVDNFSGSLAWSVPVARPASVANLVIEPSPLVDGPSGLTDTTELLRVSLAHTRVYRFNPAVLGRASFKRRRNPMLESDGSNLAEVLADRKLKSEGSFNRISEACRKIVPILQAVRLDDAEVTETIETTMMIDGRAVPQTRTAVHSGYEVRLDLLGAANVAAQHASEGTLLALAICTAAMDSRGSPLVLLDEIDRGLHPSAQVSLVRQLQEAIKAFPGLQIIATTHSPDLVDACDAASVRVFNLDSQGHAVVRPLVSHPEAAKWLKLLRVGEFWGTVGEDWVAPKAQQ